MNRSTSHVPTWLLWFAWLCHTAYPVLKEVLKETWTQQQTLKRIQEIYVKYTRDGQKQDTHIKLWGGYISQAESANEIWPWRDHYFKNLKCKLKSLKNWNNLSLACIALWGRCQTMGPCPWDYRGITATIKPVGIPWPINLKKENAYTPANIIIITK